MTDPDATWKGLLLAAGLALWLWVVGAAVLYVAGVI